MRSLIEVIYDAEQNKKAIGHFNVATLEQISAVANAARRLNLPVIVGVSEGEGDFMGIDVVIALRDVYRKSGVKMYVNADHMRTLQKVEKAARAGFDSIIFDAANLLFEENIKQTREAVKIVKKYCSWRKKILIEGELGYIGASSQIFDKIPEGAAIEEKDLTKPEDAKHFVKETDVDVLAPAVGNVHGLLAKAITRIDADDSDFNRGTRIDADDFENPPLDIWRISEIKRAVGVPLVLHGGSGISDEDFHAAIQAGISVVHISTELRVAWKNGIQETLEEKPNEVAPYKILEKSAKNLENIIVEKMRLFSGEISTQ